jgi:hypothetical protein
MPVASLTRCGRPQSGWNLQGSPVSQVAGAFRLACDKACMHGSEVPF